MKTNTRRVNSYAQKRRVNGGDYYGTWREGKQVNADRINGRTLVYDARKGWK